MQTITVEEGIKRFFAGEPVKLMVSDTGRFEDLRPVDAQLYLKMLLRNDRMVFFEDDKAPEWAKEPWVKRYNEEIRKSEYQRHRGTPHRTKTANKPGNREFDRLCKQQDETGDFSKELCAKIEAALEIYDDEDAGVWEEPDT